MVLRASGIEDNHSIDVGERYHVPLGRVFNGIRIDNTGLSDDLTLRFAVKSVNDTMGPDGLDPSLLVYGRLLRFSGHDAHPLQSYRKKTMVAPLSKAPDAASASRNNTDQRIELPLGV